MTRNVVVFAIYVVITILIAWTVPVWVPSDVGHYMDMVNGLEIAEPWNTRVMIPWIVRTLGGSYEGFVFLNLCLFAIALWIYARVYDLVTAMAFVIGTFGVLQIVVQLPMLESGILLLIAVALWVREKGNGLWFIPLCVFAAMTHPIAFTIVGVICHTSGYGSKASLLVMLPGIMFMALLWPTGYGIIMQPVEIYKMILSTVGVFWIGLLRIKRNRQGVSVLAVLVCCLGFSLLATWTAKMMYYSVLFLAPYVLGTDL